ncbi:hypothetical protein QAD02_007394 [Eretmocerus hayati]|uniref:Uncharacterized protein n=1 Tax=Eretmocerus hayati TaxID=131215 RepID=A0ACC2N3J5_9HYME|nr:hypothetical protein QAD02_007394 [Eretmocerus hayati]
MASVGKHGPDKVPPDISFKCHPKKTAGIVQEKSKLDTGNEHLFDKNEILQQLNNELKENNSLLEENNELMKSTMKNRQNQENTALTCAQTAAMKSNQSIVNVPDIIIELQGQDKEKEKSTEQIKNTLSEKTNCPINKLKGVRNKIYIKCRDPKDIQKVSEVLLKEENLKINIEVEKMKEPRINVVGVDPCMIDTDDGHKEERERTQAKLNFRREKKNKKTKRKKLDKQENTKNEGKAELLEVEEIECKEQRAEYEELVEVETMIEKTEDLNKMLHPGNCGFPTFLGIASCFTVYTFAGVDEYASERISGTL